MFVRRTNRFLVAVAVTLLFVATPAVLGQKVDQKLLDQQVLSFTMRGTIHQILSRISVRYMVPIGLKAISDSAKPSDKEITIRVRSGNVRTILNRIVEADPRYKWEEIDGVVNVIPKEDSDSLLSTIVGEFQIGGRSRMELRQAIFDLPEVKSKLDSTRVRPLHAELISAASKEVFSLTPVVLTNVTLKDILNYIIRHSNVRYWVISRFGEEKEFLIINF